MMTCALVALGLALGSAQAADIGELPYLLQAEMVLTQNPIEEAKAKKEAEEAEREARLAALEAAQSGVTARVVVLAWAGAPDVNYEHGGLQTNVKSRIARPDAKFIPEIDLYQVGRRHPDRSLSPAEQPGSVPAEAMDTLMYAVQDIETVPWNGMSEADWGITANSLRDLTEEIWFIDRPELREPLFMLYVQIGRAAENMNNPVAPFYEHIGGQLLNYYWYLAGVMAYEDPGLLSHLTNEEMNASITYYKDLLDNQEIPFMTLSFEQGGVWDAKKFAGEYTVFINGIEVLISDPQALHNLPPGRVDIFLKRGDGFSISDRVQLDKLRDKVYFVRDTARKRMGIDLVDQLMEHPNECSPRIEGDILTPIAIYASLHQSAEVYFAVPVAGDPGKVLLWRWNFEAKTLTKVLDETGGFPVRFAVIGGAGMTFNGAGATVDPCASTDPITGDCIPGEPETSIEPAGAPLLAQLRIHYVRLMLVVGVEGSIAFSDPGYQDYYQLGDGHTAYQTGSETEALKTLPINRLVYGGIGLVLFKKASLGIGPRGYIRGGWYNSPHMLDLTLHGGLTAEPPGMEQEGRVRLILDAEGFIGAMIPFGDTQFENVLPSFGATIGAGMTF
jgi:hypothetical protein